MRVPDPKANTTTEAYLAYKAGYLEESELKPKLYEPDLHFDGWLAYWAGLVNTYPTKENGDPEMLCDEEALVAYLAGVTDTYPEEIKDPYDVRIVGYLKYLVSARWGRPDYPVNNEEFYLSTMDASHTSNPTPSSDIELDTSAGKIIDVKAYGDTYQQTYSGKNLIDFANTTVRTAYLATYNKQDNSLTVTMTDTNKYASVNTDTFSCVSGETYTFSIKATKPTTSGAVPNVRLGKNDNSTANIIGYATSTLDGNIYKISLTFTADSDFTLNLSYYPNYDNTAIAETTFYDVQLENGSQVTDYEPYVGGIPAPNPDYPQDVQVVTGEQTVNVHGKNLFNPADYDGLTFNADGSINTTKYYASCSPVTLKLKPNTRYTITERNPQGQVARNNIDFSVNGVWINMNAGIQYINTGADGIIVLRAGAPAYPSIGQATGYIQLEEGSTATSYEPYQFQTYTINLGSTELCKIGDYQDYIYKSGDDWYVHKEFGKYTFTGSETFNYQSVYGGFTITSSNLISYMPGIQTPLNGYSNYFTIETSTTTWTGEGKIGLSASGTFWAKSTAFGSTQQSCETWLSTNTPTVYYILATPTDTKITDATLISELEALAGADTYNEKTFIKVTATDPNLPALLKVEAYKY